MLKYDGYDIVFQELPDEISLAVNVTGCPYLCEGCHSPHLRECYGEPLTPESVDNLIESYHSSLTAFLFLGGDRSPKQVVELSNHIKNKWGLRIGVFSGANDFHDAFLAHDFTKLPIHYYKIGAYQKKLGGLREPSTNQKLYRLPLMDVYNWQKKRWEALSIPAIQKKEKEMENRKKKVYFAAPMFAEAFREWNTKVANLIREKGYEVYNPCENLSINDKTKTDITNVRIFEADYDRVKNCDILFAVLDYEDPGVVSELTSALMLGKEVVVMTTDTRLLTPPNPDKGGVDNQTLYLNQYVIGLAKAYGVKLCSSTDEALRYV